MPDLIFTHSRLAACYDAFDQERDDLNSYLAIARETGARRVLDVGCGTGCLAVRLAAAGLEVTGADPAEASLDVARSKDPGSRITWVNASAAAVPAVGADLAVMTGNVAQVFLTDAEWAQALGGIRAALRPSGYLAFETRRPEYRVWEEWAADTVPVTRDIPGTGLVEQRREVISVALPLVSFRYTYRFSDGAVIVSDSTLRFRSQDEVMMSLVGYQVLDVREAPDRLGREMVFLARRSA